MLEDLAAGPTSVDLNRILEWFFHFAHLLMEELQFDEAVQLGTYIVVVAFRVLCYILSHSLIALSYRLVIYCLIN